MVPHALQKAGLLMAVLRSLEWTDEETGERHYDRYCHPLAPKFTTEGHGVSVPMGTTDADLEHLGWQQRGNGWICPLHTLSEGAP